MSDQPRQTHLSISSGTIVRFFAILILILACYFLSDVLLVVIAAVIIASSIEPVIRRLKNRGVHRIVGTVILYILLAAILAAIVIFFMPMVINDVSGFINSAPRSVSLGDLWPPISDIGSGSLATRTISVSDFTNGLKTFFDGGASNGAGVFHAASVIFGGFLSLLLIVVLSFYLSAQEDGVGDFLRIVTPIQHQDYIINLWRRSQRKIAFWLQGQIILGIIVGILVYIMLSIVGIKHALALAIFAAVLEIIPVFGPIVSSIPAILVAFTNDGLGTGLLLVVLYLIIYQLESQILYPLVVKKVVGVSPVVVILALVIGFRLAGLLGALIAVPLSAVFMEYVSDLEKKKKAARETRPETPHAI
jgi:predicted PurR-regulated permease PerM